MISSISYYTWIVWNLIFRYKRCQKSVDPLYCTFDLLSTHLKNYLDSTRQDVNWNKKTYTRTSTRVSYDRDVKPRRINRLFNTNLHRIKLSKHNILRTEDSTARAKGSKARATKREQTSEGSRAMRGQQNEGSRTRVARRWQHREGSTANVAMALGRAAKACTWQR